MLEGGVEEALHVRNLSHIGLHGDSTTTRRLDGGNGLARSLLVTRVVDNDSGSVLTEPHGDSPPNPP